MVAIVKVVRIILFANGGGLHPSSTPHFLKAIHACKKHASCHQHVCSGERCADHFVCNWGGCATPPIPPRLYKAMHAYGANSTPSPCLPQGKVMLIILFANGAAGSPDNSDLPRDKCRLFFKHITTISVLLVTTIATAIVLIGIATSIHNIRVHYYFPFFLFWLIHSTVVLKSFLAAFQIVFDTVRRFSVFLISMSSFY